jgi:DNA-binding transcriptional MerR regulator
MDIGEVARRTGLRASALRYYESKGLIRANGRVGARRQFADDVLERLALISLGRSAGLSLDEIGQMFGTDGSLRVDRAVLRARAGDFDRQIQRLAAMRDGLLHAAECRAENHLACPTFQRLLRAGSRLARPVRTLVALALMLFAAPLLAQGSGLNGRVTDTQSRPIGGAIVLAQLDGATQQTRTESTGEFSLPGLRPGRWQVVIRSLGFAPDSAQVIVSAGGTRHDVRLERVTALDRRVIEATWTGVIGVVGTSDYRPLPDATVRVVGQRVFEKVNGSGGFAIPWPGEQSILLRVSAPGYSDRLVSARIPARGSLEISVLLDTTRAVGATALMADELERRMNWAGTSTAFVTREEMLQSGTRDALRALEGTPSFTRRGLVIERDACLFVNGLPRPGYPFDAIDPATIEFIEVYTASSENTGLLASRWPRGGMCGAPVSAQHKRRVPPSQLVRYVVVWTRER